MQLWVVVAVLAALAASSSATITLPTFFASSMVLRADVPVLITGVEDNPAGVQPCFGTLQQSQTRAAHRPLRTTTPHRALHHPVFVCCVYCCVL